MLNLPPTNVPLRCDYLVVGAGPKGIAFLDSLLREDSGCTAILVDSHAQPGGRWNIIYPYARVLHSVFYGCASRRLEADTENTTDSDGHVENRASRDELLAYFKKVLLSMTDSGRVRFFPKCIASSDGTTLTHSLNSKKVWHVHAERKVVFSFGKSPVPARPLKAARAFQVSDNVHIVTPNDLPDVGGHDNYVVLGGGQAGVDTVLWLLHNGVDAGCIGWVVREHEWLVNRGHLEPDTLPATMTHVYEAMTSAKCRTVQGVMLNIEKFQGLLCRLDPTQLPTAYFGSSVTTAELNELRQVRIRTGGKLTAVLEDSVQMIDGNVATNSGTLHIDCTGYEPKLALTTPVFASARRIELQSLGELHMSVLHPTASAGMVGHLEAVAPEDWEHHNRRCTPLPELSMPEDFIRLFHVDFNRTFTKRESTWNFVARPNMMAACSLEGMKTVVAAEFKNLRKECLVVISEVMRTSVQKLSDGQGQDSREGSPTQAAECGSGSMCSTRTSTPRGSMTPLLGPKAKTLSSDEEAARGAKHCAAVRALWEDLSAEDEEEEEEAEGYDDLEGVWATC